MGLGKEFKEFISRGNVIDLAVGIIIGGAFGKIVSSLVGDIIMPPIGMAIGGVNFTDLKLPIKAAELDAAGKVVKEAVTVNYGNFIQALFDFMIVAMAIFLLVKAVNSLRKKKAAEEPAPTPIAPTGEELLLAEIRDLLKTRGGNV
ncbi:MAG: large-conductance mechanosensitive channel protein MscL [Sphingobacteriales bacterium]|nr:MAG: large-conductance mechanosensitive channel protein MscL [Sphingobacteriales bacterium]